MNSLSVLNSNDINWCLHRLPKRVKALMQEYAGQLVMAGGFIRACIANEHINDVDLFPASKELAQVMALKLAGGDLKSVYETENAYTVSRHLPMSVQFIHRWIFAQPEEILPSFDFTIAQAAIWFEALARDENGKVVDGEWKSLCSAQFYPDLAAKRLVYLQPIRNEDAGGSMLRVLKFYQRGYRIPIDSLGQVISRLMTGVDISRIHTEQKKFDKDSEIPGLVFDEQQLSKVVTGLLREVDPLIDPAHVSHLPATEAVGVARDAGISTRVESGSIQ